MAERTAPGTAAHGAAAEPGDPRPEVRSVMLVTPRWVKDGGVGTHVIASAAALAQRGLRVSVLTARAEETEPTPGVEVLTSPGLCREGLTVPERLGDALRSVPDVIHIHQVDHPEIVAAMRRAAPVVMSAHGYTACTSGVHYFRPGQECGRAHGPGCVANLLLRGCAHENNPRRLPGNYRGAGRGVQALRTADVAVCYSSAIDRHLAANGVSSRRIVPLFTTMVPARGAGHESRRRVVFAGRVVAPKGVDVLIRAARDLDAEFVVCGDGWRLDQMRRLADRLGVAARFTFTGWLDAQRLARELAEASVVAVPSLWPEPFGLVGIEAFAAGRPVVASATGGIGDWLQDGVNGLAVKPGDPRALGRALQELLSDPTRQQQMGEAGRQLVAARFSTERHAAALLDAYGAARAAWRS